MRNCFSFFLANIIWLCGAQAATVAVENKFRLDVIAQDGTHLPVQVILPGHGKLKAIVVVVPGSGGLEDPYFNSELAKPVYDPNHRGGLTQALLSAGFGAVFYNQRGYNNLSSCAAGAQGPARAREFVDRCIDQRVRSLVDLDTITSDTQSIFTQMGRERRTSSLPLLVLASSEGMYHATRAIQSTLKKPNGIVSIGGAITSLQSTSKYQITHTAFFNAIKRAFLACPSDRVDLKQALRCAGLPADPEWINGVGEAMGSDLIIRSEIKQREEYWNAQYQRAKEIFSGSASQGALSGSFEGIHIEKNWAGSYYSEIFNSTPRSLSMLRNFHGRVIYLFGEFDHLMQIPAASEFSAEALDNNVVAEMKIVPAVNHGLTDSSGIPSNESLGIIISSLEKALLPIQK